jgi:hypothetical protein
VKQKASDKKEKIHQIVMSTKEGNLRTAELIIKVNKKCNDFMQGRNPDKKYIDILVETMSL